MDRYVLFTDYSDRLTLKSKEGNSLCLDISEIKPSNTLTAIWFLEKYPNINWYISKCECRQIENGFWLVNHNCEEKNLIKIERKEDIISAINDKTEFTSILHPGNVLFTPTPFNLKLLIELKDKNKNVMLKFIKRFISFLIPPLRPTNIFDHYQSKLEFYVPEIYALQSNHGLNWFSIWNPINKSLTTEFSIPTHDNINYMFKVEESKLIIENEFEYIYLNIIDTEKNIEARMEYKYDQKRSNICVNTDKNELSFFAIEHEKNKYNQIKDILINRKYNSIYINIELTAYKINSISKIIDLINDTDTDCIKISMPRDDIYTEINKILIN